MSNKFKLNVNDQGKVRYITRAGKDLVLATTSEESAEWMMKNKPITRETPTDWPTFSVCAGGDFWFDGSWEDEPSIFTADDKKPTTNTNQELFAEKPQERQRTKSRRRGE